MRPAVLDLLAADENLGRVPLAQTQPGLNGLGAGAFDLFAHPIRRGCSCSCGTRAYKESVPCFEVCAEESKGKNKITEEERLRELAVNNEDPTQSKIFQNKNISDKYRKDAASDEDSYLPSN